MNLITKEKTRLFKEYNCSTLDEVEGKIDKISERKKYVKDNWNLVSSDIQELLMFFEDFKDMKITAKK